MNLLAIAIQFAATKHLTQLDKGGSAYILHPIRMMMRLRTQDEELMAIAILHDVVEDCDVTLKDLYDIGMTQRVVEGVDALTKRPNELYEKFIDRVGENIDAMLVKREDLKDNSSLSRLKGVTEKDAARMQKYSVAYLRIQELISKSENKVD